MKKIDLFEKTNRKKILSIGATVLAVFLAVALILGIVQGLSQNGGWSLWASYRYEDEGYMIGSGSVPSTQLRTLNVDWIDGEVEIVLCQDAYLSITETSQKTLSENAKLRWSISEDGTIFTVKYRKSTAFLGFGEGGDSKKLTLRVPASVASQLNEVYVNAGSASVRVEGVSCRTLAITTKTGKITVEDGVYNSITLTSQTGDLFASPTTVVRAELLTERGDADLELPADVGFSLCVQSKNFVCDRILTETADGYLFGDGATSLSIVAEAGAVRVNTKK